MINFFFLRNQQQDNNKNIEKYNLYGIIPVIAAVAHFWIFLIHLNLALRPKFSASMNEKNTYIANKTLLWYMIFQVIEVHACTFRRI